ncbi:MAG: hypothetical protein K2W99_03105 [Chthoniobacterales bacterium]|nr:hypothetical protein [Chthoniobacterales bacterium]
MNRLYLPCLFFLLVGEICLSPSLLAQLPEGYQTTLKSTPSSSIPELSNHFFKKYAEEVVYLDLRLIGYDVTQNLIIGTPPAEGSVLQKEDELAREAISTQATLDEKIAALSAIDNVFAFSVILGNQFNYKLLKDTEAFFQAVDSEVGGAVAASKKTFRRPRPMKSNGFAYPSGHSTRAFVREELLSEIFPQCREALYNQARQFAQNRVIIGRHYPRDIAAGEIYGKYLADQFRKNPDFKKKWNKVKKEIAVHFQDPCDLNPILIPIVTPAIVPVTPPIISE